MSLWERKAPRKKRLTRHELMIEIKMLEVERDRAVWERDRHHATTTAVINKISLALIDVIDGVLEEAEEMVENCLLRDGGAFDVLASSGMGAF